MLHIPNELSFYLSQNNDFFLVQQICIQLVTRRNYKVIKATTNSHGTLGVNLLVRSFCSSVCIEKENEKWVSRTNEPLMVAFQEIGKDRWEDISGRGSFWVPFRLYHTSHFLFLCRRFGSAATTLSISPENSISISVFYKKVEAPLLLAVRDQEGAFTT